MKYVVCLHLYIPWKFGERGSTPRGDTGPSLSFLFVCFCLFVCFFVCPSCYDSRHRKPRRCIYALNLGGTGISPPDKSPSGQKSPRPKFPPAKSAPGKRPPGKKCPAATYSIAAVAGNWTILSLYAVTGLIGGAVLILLLLILILMFVVYRMRKKDEGSYSLDEPRHSFAYTRAKDQEFFAWTQPHTQLYIARTLAAVVFFWAEKISGNCLTSNLYSIGAEKHEL